MRRVFVAFTLGVLLSFSGCAAMHQGTVTHKVTVAQHNLLTVVAAFEDAEIAEYNAGFIPADVHLKIQQIVKQVALGGKDLDQALAANADATTIKAKIDVIYKLLDQLQTDGLTGVKNDKSKAVLELALNQIKTLLDMALTQVS